MSEDYPVLRYVLAVRRRDRDRWPDEPKETHEPAQRDRDGGFDDPRSGRR
jgi:hypothetical protein